jgi:hypothetical protein
LGFLEFFIGYVYGGLFYKEIDIMAIYNKMAIREYVGIYYI